MKKLLLLFTMALVSIGSQAGPGEFSWSSGSYAVALSVVDPQPWETTPPVETFSVQTAGSLAAWVAYVTSEEFTSNIGEGEGKNKPFMELGSRPTQHQGKARKLKIEGPLNEDDLEALASLAGFSNYLDVDLTGVSLAGGVTADTVLNTIDFGPKSWQKPKPGGETETVNGVGAQYIALPYGVTNVADMTKLTQNGKNSTLKVAGTYKGSPSATGTAADKSEFAAYSFVKGNMKGFLTSLFPEISDNPYESYIQKLSLGGQIAVNDISQGNGTERMFRSTNLQDMDLLECKFEDCQITITSAMGQGYINPLPSGTIDTNALYYLRNYNLVSCILPKYNDEIPPQTFANNTFNAQTVHIGNIVIPEGYKKIGFEAFYGHNLQSLDLPSTLEEVQAGAFRHNPGMSRLTDVTMQPLQGECTFGEAAFGENQMLKHVTLSEGVTNIADQMFNQCLLLESIRIPTTCKTIGRRAFYECYDLHVITIPEGVEEIYQEAFELTGLTDIYIMATSPATVPKIYAMAPDGISNPNSTFTYQRTTGNNTVPAAHRKDLPWVNDGYDEVVSWYQAEMSGSKGLGTGNALVALHYPDNMKGFYEGINVSDFFSPEELADVCGWRDADQWVPLLASGTGVTQADVNEKIHGVDAQGNQFQYLPQAYSIDPHGDGSNPLMGPDKDGKYYPNQMDYVMRMAAGATPENCMSAWGWRQFPLAAAVGDIGKIPFDKLYDDTWYTMCFPWHMTDNELFSAFNQNMEITEFVGAEMIDQNPNASEGEDKEYALVLHFDDVAVTTYRDTEDVEYNREKIGHRIINGEDRSVYRYTSKTQVDGQTIVVEYPLAYKDLNEQEQNSGWQNPPGKDDTSDAAQAVREAYGKYLSIRNILSNAGHPYMIHPSIGARPGRPATVYINAELKTGSPWTTNDQKVTKVATIDDQEQGEMNSGATVAPNKGGQTAFVNPITGGGGSYTFIGNVGKEAETDNVDNDGNKVMPTPAYFLAVPETGEYETVDIFEDQLVPVFEDDGVTPVMVYQPKEGGNYNKVVTPAYYEYVGSGNGDYTASAWTEADPAGSGNYQEIPAVIQYVDTNDGTYTATAWEQVASGTGHYSAQQQQRTENCWVLGNNGYYSEHGLTGTYVGAGNGDYTLETFNRSDGQSKQIFVYKGQGQGDYTVTSDDTKGDWHYVWGSATVTITEYHYEGATPSADYEATAFAPAANNDGEVNYTPKYYQYVAQGGQNYIVAGYTAQTGGEYLYHPEVVSYEQVAAGTGSYEYVQLTRMESVKVGEMQVPIYDVYPKFYRKTKTSGYKWSKYSAIIQPDAAAITNIENYLNYQQAQANGFDVVFGEWEVVTPTAIDEIVAEAEQRNEPVQKIHLNVVYNIKGQVVRNDGNISLEGLPKGLYIVNGKKYMVK